MNIVPKKKFEHRIRPVIFREEARLREKRFISDAIGRHNNLCLVQRTTYSFTTI